MSFDLLGLGGPEVPTTAEAKAAKKAAKQAGRRVNWDKFCKCIPLIATVNTIFNMHQKSAYQEKIKNGVDDPKLMDTYHQRIIHEPTWQQVVLLVPVLGQIVVGIAAAVESCNKSVDKSAEEPMLSRSNFDAGVNYESSYVVGAPGAPEEQLEANDRFNILQEKVNFDLCSPADLHQLVQYATKEGRFARAQFLLGKYFVVQHNMSGDPEDFRKAKFWLDQAKTNHWLDAITFLNDNPEFKVA